MKIKNKGKVYPSPSSFSSSSSYTSSPSSSSSSSSYTSSNGDSLSVLKLLPSEIIALASVLSLEDREVLAYLITRSIKMTATAMAATNASCSSIIQRKASKRAVVNGRGSSNNTHRPPVFDCDCFDCYTSYWFRWDSSTNRELIHQAIEAFEDHLTNGESQKSKKNGKAKRRDKMARLFADKDQVVGVEDIGELSSDAVVDVAADAENFPENDVAVATVTVSSPEKEEAKLLEEHELVEEERQAVFLSTEAAASSCSHKGLARKVLPDVLGLFNSRLWSLWSPSA